MPDYNKPQHVDYGIIEGKKKDNPIPAERCKSCGGPIEVRRDDDLNLRACINSTCDLYYTHIEPAPAITTDDIVSGFYFFN